MLLPESREDEASLPSPTLQLLVILCHRIELNYPHFNKQPGRVRELDSFSSQSARLPCPACQCSSDLHRAIVIRPLCPLEYLRLRHPSLFPLHQHSRHTANHVSSDLSPPARPYRKLNSANSFGPG